jgi:hypothetical protein
MLTTSQTIVASLIAFVLLPNGLSDARFLTMDEKMHSVQRLRGVEHGTGDSEQ